MDNFDWTKTPEYFDKDSLILRLSPERFREEYLGKFENKWPNILFIVAQTYEETRRWARENDCPPKVWRYIFDVEILEGVRRGQVIKLHIHFWNKHIVDILRQIEYLVSLDRLEYVDEEDFRD